MAGLWAVPRAVAEPGDTNTGRTAPSMLVLDASGSMRETDVDGRARMDVAKEAVGSLIPLLPEDAQVGLMTYGNSTEQVAADKAAACQDIKVLVEPTGLDRAALAAGVDGVTARGYTPIGASLRAAVDALPEAEMRSVVLVSDGIEECDTTPPCQVAEELAAAHPEVRIHTIGFRTDEAAREELACIARATGGTYADATDAEMLREELLLRMTRALQGYDDSGQAITGGDDAVTAVPITPGSFLDVLEHGSPAADDGDGAERYYRLRLAEGEVAHVAATMVIPAAGGADNKLAQLSLRILDPEGADCRVGDTNARTEAALGDGPLTAMVSTPRMGRTQNLACFGADAGGEVVIVVERTGTPSQEESVPLELQIFIEQETDTDGLPPAMPWMLEREPLQVAADGEVAAPAFAFAAATEVGDGPIRGTIIPGEVQFFRIPVQYGQQARVSLGLGDVTVPEGMSLTTRITMISPLRQPVYTATPPSTDASPSGASAPARSGLQMHLNQAVPVEFRNREEGGTEARSSFLAGDYYIQLALIPDTYDTARLFEVPFVLDADVVGEVDEGPELDGQGEAEREDQLAEDPGQAPADAAAGGGGTAAGAGASDGGGRSGAAGAPGSDLEPRPDGEPGMLRMLLPVAAGLTGGAVLAGAVIAGVAVIRRR